MSDESEHIRIVDKRGGKQPEPAEEPNASDETEGAELSELQRLADDRLDQLMRLKADFENFRQRVVREQTELVDRASLRIVEQLLPVLDDLGRALGAARERRTDDALLRGVELIHEQLNAVLVAEGLEEVDAEGAFDPNDHEAVMSVPGDVDEPTILEVVRPGYKLRSRTIRPALVQVSVPEDAGGVPSTEDEDAEDEGA